MTTKGGTNDTKEMEMTNLGSGGASTEEDALMTEQKGGDEEKTDNAPTKQGDKEDVDPSTVTGTKEFHQRPHLLKLTFTHVCLGVAPLLFLIVMAIFGIIVYSIAQKEMTPAPTMEPTMSPVTKPPSISPSMAPTMFMFEAKRNMIIDATLAEGPHLILDAYRGNALDQAQLNSSKNELTKENADFDLIDLVRLLYLTDGTYDDEILEAINSTVTPLWLRNNDTLQWYWTETHMILWDSSAFLLKQKFPDLETNDNVYNRIVSYLQLKINYGYFSLNSAAFVPLKMAGLLNLADFSEDTMIQSLAVDALEVLLLEVINNVNSEGAYYPAQARGDADLYSSSADMFNSGIVQVIHALTGLGPTATGLQSSLATTNVDNLANILDRYRPMIDGETQTVGIPITSFDDFNDQTNYPLTDDDRTVFQFSADLYWIPEIVNDTLDFVNKYNLWGHPQFEQRAFFQDPVGTTGLTYQGLKPFTGGIAINEITTVLYKNGPAMLSSFQLGPDNGFRYLGHEQFVWAATTGTVALWSKGGDGSPGGFDNVHLPWVNQTKNVALIVYDASLMTADPYKTLLGALGGVTDIKNAYIYIPEGEFDDVVTDGNWYLAMETGSNGIDGYVGLRRDSNCIYPVENGMITCDATQSAWGVVVGSSTQYETFDAFQSVVTSSTYDELENKLTVDGISIEFGQFG